MTASSPAASQTNHPAAAIAGDAPTVIEIRDLHKAYGSLEVLKGVSISARRGDVVRSLAVPKTSPFWPSEPSPPPAS